MTMLHPRQACRRQPGGDQITQARAAYLLAASCTIPKEPAPSTLTVSYLGLPAKGLKLAYWFCRAPFAVISRATGHEYQQALLEQAWQARPACQATAACTIAAQLAKVWLGSMGTGQDSGNTTTSTREEFLIEAPSSFQQISKVDFRLETIKNPVLIHAAFESCGPCSKVPTRG